MTNKQLLILTFFISLFIHVIIVKISILPSQGKNNPPKVMSPNNAIKIINKRLRKVGKKKNKRIDTVKKMRKQKSLLDFFKKIAQKTINDFDLNKNSYLSYESSAQISKSTISSPLKEVSRFRLNIDPPKGVNFNQLNSMEKVLHGFNVRVYKTFINSFFKTLKMTQYKYPLIEKELLSGQHKLKGKVTFDKYGNILKINIIKSSSNDHIHNLFEKTLRDINKIPNPPRIIINDQGQFVIYFNLIVN